MKSKRNTRKYKTAVNILKRQEFEETEKAEKNMHK